MFVRSFVVVLLSTTALANAAPFVVTERPQPEIVLPAPNAGKTQSPETTAPPKAVKVVDESALRYYAKHNQVDRMEAEIRRLQALYPDWQVPDDLTSDKPYAGEEQPLWDLYAADKLPELERAIAERRAQEPGWEPSAELNAKLKIKQQRALLLQASDARQWDKVIDIAAANPVLTDCSDVEVLWRLAEAYNGISRASRSEEVYKYILSNCSVPQERLATVRKALTMLGVEPARRLMELGAPGEFDVVNDDILAIRFSNVVAGKAKDDLTNDEKKRAAELAEKKGDIGFMTLLGWYAWAKGDSKTSLKWFQMGMNAQGNKADVKTVEGVVLALHDLGRDDEALKISTEWHSKAEAIENLYIGLMVIKLSRQPPETDVTPDQLATYQEVITRRKAYNGASAMGWYAFGLKQYETAEKWFNTTLDWTPAELNTNYAEKAANGDARVAVLIARLASNVAGTKTYEMTDDERAKLEKAAKGGDATVAGLLGWYERKRGNINDAYNWFQAGMDIPGQEKNPEFIEGIVLCLHDLGRRDEAMEILNKWKDESADLTVMWVNFSAEGLTATETPPNVDPAQIAALAAQVNKLKSAPGANALGWYAFKLDQFDTAAKWFHQSMVWEPSEASATGQILAAFRLGDKDATKTLAQTYSAAFPAVADLSASLLKAIDPPRQVGKSGAVGYAQNGAALAAKNRRDYAGCVSILSSRTSLAPGDSLTLGWCLMELHRPNEALNAFEGAMSGRGQIYSDAVYGKSLAMVQLGMSNSAASVAASDHLSLQRRREVGVAVLASQANALYNAGRYREALAVLDERARFTSEEPGLSLLRGWALYNMGYTDQARQVFTYVNSVFPNREAVNALQDINRR